MAEQQRVSVEVAGRRLAVSNLDKVMYPATETTKGEVLHYYARVAPTLLAHLARRPVTRIRWPHGVEGASFFEKNLPPGAPAWLPSVTISSHGRNPEDHPERDRVVYPLVLDLADLTYLVNLASLELHVPQWQVDDSGQPRDPDRLVIDLDPGSGAGLRECAQVALWVRPHLEAMGLTGTVPVTSGQGHAGVCRAAGQALGRRHPRAGPTARPGDDKVPPGSRRVEDDEVAAPRKGPVGLEPEHRRKDDDQPLLVAGKACSLCRGPAHLGRGGAGGRG